MWHFLWDFLNPSSYYPSHSLSVVFPRCPLAKGLNFHIVPLFNKPSSMRSSSSLVDLLHPLYLINLTYIPLNIDPLIQHPLRLTAFTQFYVT